MSLPIARPRIRLLFLLLIPFLFAQYLLAKWFLEPYPSLVYPGFGTIPDQGEYISYGTQDILVFDDAGARDTLDAHALFHGLPRHYVPVILSKSFREDTRPEGPDQKPFRKLRIGAFYYEVRRYMARDADPVIQAEGRAWLRDRIQALTGRSDWQRMEVHWHSFRKYAIDHVPPVEKTGTEVFSFSLQP